jgi:hypothetical protein
MNTIKPMACLTLASGMAACAGTKVPVPPPTATSVQAPFYVESAELLAMESYPVQVVLQVDGQLPDPCHEAMWTVSEPDPQGRIDVRLYSQAPGELDCIQVLKPASLRIPIGSFKSGSFSVWLNGEQVGTLTV